MKRKINRYFAAKLVHLISGGSGTQGPGVSLIFFWGWSEVPAPLPSCLATSSMLTLRNEMKTLNACKIFLTYSFWIDLKTLFDQKIQLKGDAIS